MIRDDFADAIKNGDIKKMRELLAVDPGLVKLYTPPLDRDKGDVISYSPLALAIVANNLEAVKLLIECNANMFDCIRYISYSNYYNLISEDGITAYEIACGARVETTGTIVNDLICYYGKVTQTNRFNDELCDLLLDLNFKIYKMNEYRANLYYTYKCNQFCSPTTPIDRNDEKQPLWRRTLAFLSQGEALKLVHQKSSKQVILRTKLIERLDQLCAVFHLFFEYWDKNNERYSRLNIDGISQLITYCLLNEFPMFNAVAHESLTASTVANTHESLRKKAVDTIAKIGYKHYRDNQKNLINMHYNSKYARDKYRLITECLNDHPYWGEQCLFKPKRELITGLLGACKQSNLSKPLLNTILDQAEVQDKLMPYSGNRTPR